MPEYTFDVVLWANCRVQAESEASARAAMLYALGAVEINFDHNGVQLTEAHIEDDGGASELLAIDGKEV